MSISILSFNIGLITELIVAIVFFESIWNIPGSTRSTSREAFTFSILIFAGRRFDLINSLISLLFTAPFVAKIAICFVFETETAFSIGGKTPISFVEICGVISDNT